MLLDDRIDAVALSLGLPKSMRDVFMAELQLAFRPGDTGWTGPDP